MQTSQAHSVRQREAFQIAWIHLSGGSLDPQQEGILFDIKASPASYQKFEFGHSAHAPRL